MKSSPTEFHNNIYKLFYFKLLDRLRLKQLSSSDFLGFLNIINVTLHEQEKMLRTTSCLQDLCTIFQKIEIMKYNSLKHPNPIFCLNF